MSKSTRFFRIVWRINALLIFVAAAAAACGVVYFVISEIESSARSRHAAAVQPAVVPAKSNEDDLHLGGMQEIENTPIFRAALVAGVERVGKSSYGSGDSSENRNLLFLDSSTGAAKWLLPTHREVISRYDDVEPEWKSGQRKPPPLATTAIVAGRLLIFQIDGARVTQVASNVADLRGTIVEANGDITLLFDSAGKYHLLRLNAKTFATISDRTVDVPVLK